MRCGNWTVYLAYAMPAPLVLGWQSFNVGFDGSNPKLHGVALIRHTYESARSNRYRVAINLDGVPEEAGFVLGDREHNAIAADAAAEGTASCAIGHSGIFDEWAHALYARPSPLESSGAW